MAEQMKASSTVRDASAIEGSSQGARRATEEVPSIAPPPNPEVATVAQRRQFSSAHKRRVLAEADACSEPGQIGALLRREGIYSSLLSTWRAQRKRAEHGALQPKPRGPKAEPNRAEAKRVAELERENERLRRTLAQAYTIIDVQKKLCTLLGLPAAEAPSEPRE
jgi:transposase-like protein